MHSCMSAFKCLKLHSAGHLFNITAILLPANTTLYNTAQLYAQLAAALFDANVAGETHVAAWCGKQLGLHIWRLPRALGRVL